MPKPVFQDNGSGMHTHQSLWKGGENLFYDERGYALLSETALYYIGGILHHAPALLAFAAPSTNSYRDWCPATKRPSIWSIASATAARASAFPPIRQSESAAYRVPRPRPLLQSLSGVRRHDDGRAGRHPESHHATRPHRQRPLRTSPRGAGRHQNHAASLTEALDALEQDHEFLLKGGVFTPDLLETYLDYKRKREVEQILLRPHPYEFALYYDV
jgi:glutamine synthetase